LDIRRKFIAINIYADGKRHNARTINSIAGSLEERSEMSVLDNLGFVAWAHYYPCADPSPTLVIKAAAQAGVITLWSAATFGCLDIVRMRAGISPWHTRGLRMLANGINPPDVQKNINGIYKFLIPLEKLLFFHFVVDLTTGFFANWQSGLFQLGACDGLPENCDWSGDKPSWTSPHPGSEMLVTYHTTKISGNCFGLPSNGFWVPEGYHWSAYFSLNVMGINGQPQPGNVQTWLQVLAPTPFDYPKAENPAPWFGNKIHAQYAASGQNKAAGGRQIRFMASCDGVGFATGGTAVVRTSSLPFTNAGIIPVNCFGKPSPAPLG
jgi:hypothetical protein